MLPFECKRKLCTLEPDTPQGFSLACTGAYKEIQFEFIEVQPSDYDVNKLEASFDDLYIQGK